MRATSDSSGNCALDSYVASVGGTLGVGSMIWAVSPTGVVTFGGGPGDAHGYMTGDKTMVVGTMTDGGGGYTLMIFSKGN